MKAVAIALISLGTFGAALSPALAQGVTRPTAQPSAQTIAQATTTLNAVILNDDTLYLDEDKVHDYTLELTNRTAVDGRFFPAGSLIRGSFEPVQGGLRYVADSVEVGDRIFDLTAESDTLTDRKDPRETDTGDIIEDAAIGAAGGLILGEVFGDSDFLEILGGAAAGVIVGNVTAQTVVVIEPNQSILLYQN